VPCCEEGDGNFTSAKMLQNFIISSTQWRIHKIKNGDQKVWETKFPQAETFLMYQQAKHFLLKVLFYMQRTAYLQHVLKQ